MASRNSSFHDGVLGRVVLAPLKLALLVVAGLVVLLLIAWTIDWLCVFKVWPEGIARLLEILGTDLMQGTTLAAMQGSGPHTITGPANALYWGIFQSTGIHEMGTRFGDGRALSIPDTILRDAYVTHREAIQVAMVGTLLIGVRLATLACYVPLLMLLYSLAAADGFAQRAIRRAGRGRESASLYHRAKHLQVVALGLGGVVLLVWPGHVEWRAGAVPLFCAVSVLARGQWAYYKKHW